MIPFYDREQLSDLLENSPHGTILVNTQLLSERTYPTNILVGSDFDFTITQGPLSSWQMVRDPERHILSPKGIEQTLADFHRWRNVPGLKAQRLWGNSSTKIMSREGITREQLENLGKTLELRQGFLELASSVISNIGSLAVVTWGMDCMVEPCLLKTGLCVTNFIDTSGIPNGILSYAEKMRFDKKGVIKPPPIRTGQNSVFGIPKIRFMEDYRQRSGRSDQSIVFIGDSEEADSPASGPDGRSILIVDKNRPNIDTVIANTHFVLKGDTLFPLIGLLHSFMKPQDISIH